MSKPILKHLEGLIKERQSFALQLKSEIRIEALVDRGFCPNVIEDRILKLQKNDAALTALRGIQNWIINNS
jgi:hypothetical protein